MFIYFVFGSHEYAAAFISCALAVHSSLDENGPTVSKRSKSFSIG